MVMTGTSPRSRAGSGAESGRERTVLTTAVVRQQVSRLRRNLSPAWCLCTYQAQQEIEDGQQEHDLSVVRRHRAGRS